MSRIRMPTSVPPGSCVSTTLYSLFRSRSARSRICVVFPEPSQPSKVMNRPWGLVIDEVQHLLQVFPRFPLGVLVIWPEQIRRVIGHHHRYVAPLMPVSAQPHNTVLC